MTRILERRTCDHCHQPVIWGLLQNGRWRSFEPDPKPVAAVVERDRYTVHKGLRRVVDLVGVTRPPAHVLAAHYCQAYADARLFRGMAGLAEAIDAAFRPDAGTHSREAQARTAA